MNDESEKRSRGRPRAFDRTEALQRALEVFWAHGFEAASVPKLTEAMGISAQSLYAAFGSKEALYREAAERYSATVGGFGARALREEGDAIEAMRRSMREAAAVFTSNAGTPGCLITSAPAGTRAEPMTLLGRELRGHGQTLIAERLQAGIGAGQVRADIDVQAWARYVSLVLQGLSVQARDGASTEDLLAAVEVAALPLEALRRRAPDRAA